VKELGNYPEGGPFARPPYGAQFRLSGTRFAINLVVCHIETAKDKRARAAEIAHLATVYSYFEKLTGNRGITILFAGGFGKEPEQELRPLLAMERGEVIAVKAGAVGAEILHDGGARMFASAALRTRIKEVGVGASTLHAVYIVLKTGK